MMDRFYRSPSNKKEGSGIGLSIATEIINLHKGKLDIKKETGNILFTISFQANYLSEEDGDKRHHFFMGNKAINLIEEWSTVFSDLITLNLSDIVTTISSDLIAFYL